MAPDPITIPATTVEPYIHVDERSVVFCDGRHTVVCPAGRLPRLTETLDILLAEQRATRTQHEWTFGGFVEGERAVLYMSDVRAAVSLSVPVSALRDLRRALAHHVAGGA